MRPPVAAREMRRQQRCFAIMQSQCSASSTKVPSAGRTLARRPRRCRHCSGPPPSARDSGTQGRCPCSRSSGEGRLDSTASMHQLSHSMEDAPGGATRRGTHNTGGLLPRTSTRASENCWPVTAFFPSVTETTCKHFTLPAVAWPNSSTW